MVKISRLALFIFILGMILFLGLVFSAWVVPNVVQPIAETIWLFLRVFFLSVGQVHYWNLTINRGCPLGYLSTHPQKITRPARRGWGEERSDQ